MKGVVEGRLRTKPDLSTLLFHCFVIFFAISFYSFNFFQVSESRGLY
jgi:hypothetical protein